MTGKRLTKPTPCQALRAKLERVEHELRAAKLRIEEQDKQLVANANSYDGLLAHLHEAEANERDLRRLLARCQCPETIEIHV